MPVVFYMNVKKPLAWGCQWFFTRTRGPHGNRGGCCGILHVKNHSIWKPLAVVFYKNVKNHWQFCKIPQHPDGGDAVVFYSARNGGFLVKIHWHSGFSKNHYAVVFYNQECKKPHAVVFVM